MGQVVWKDIIGYEGRYQVSNQGGVRSLWYQRYKRKKPKELKLNKAPNGYLSVQLYKDNSNKRLSVHRLVVATFVGKIKKGLEVNHLNGIKTDNRLSNLKAVTKSENEKHAFQLGLKSTKGVKNSASKLREQDVKYIKKSSLTAKELADKFGVSKPLIYQLKKGIGWNHLK